MRYLKAAKLDLKRLDIDRQGAVKKSQEKIFRNRSLPLTS